MDNALAVNLALALGAAFLGALIATRLRQSVIVGYIAAGLAIGPFTPGLVGDIATVQALADIGVVFLMFAVGLQLSLADLLRVGRIAIGGGLLQVGAIIAIGYAAGIALGWSPLESLFLGAVVSNSSSTVITKVLGERGELGSAHARIGLAWSSVQDMSTIVLIVVLTALSSGSSTMAADLVVTTGKALLFLVVMVALGARLLPVLFDRVARLRNPELFVSMVAALALGLSYAASLFGLSVALGAFVAGVVVAESDLSHQILGEVRPLRDIFAGMFFVAVGMLVDPAFVLGNIGLVVAVAALIVVVKGILSTAVMRLAGYGLATSLLTGIALAQSAEFSFLLARVGADAGVLSSRTFSLLLTSAVVSIVLSPLLFRTITPSVFRVLERVPVIGSGGTEPTMTDAGVTRPRRHVVICGYGRVGSELAHALARRGFEYVIVEYDPAIVRELRRRGEPTIYGDASYPTVLEQARVSDALVLAVLMSDARAAAATTAYARREHPRLDIVARALNSEQVEQLRAAGATAVVQPEFEAGVEAIRHVFHRYGVSGMELVTLASGLRRSFYERERPDPLT